MGSGSNVGTSSTFLSNTRECVSDFGTCGLPVSSAPEVNTEDMPDTLDHPTGESSGALWAVHTHAGVQHRTEPVLQARPPEELQEPLTSCTFSRVSPSGTEVTGGDGGWLSGFKGALCTWPAATKVTRTAPAPH